MRSVAKKLHVSEKTIKRSVHEDIRYKSYVMKRCQFISEKSKENHLKRSKRFLNKFKILQKQEWMADNPYDHITPNIWTPNSPDLNPLDYYVWSVVEKEVNEHPHNTKDYLKAAIVRAMSNMNEQLIGAWNRF